MIKARRLRELLQEKPILKIMGAHNALGAKLIEKHGFDGIWASGFEIATAHGVTDANILTMTENLQVAQNIDAATCLPVLCDCDTGYGNAINVMHMVRKYESAGMAAVVIEDKCFPKMNSFVPGRQELAPIEEFVGKIEAAKTACSYADGIMVFARVEALIAGWGMEEAYRRAAAYSDAGADGIVIHSKAESPAEVFAFAQVWSKKFARRCPLIAIPTTYCAVTIDELALAGFKMVIYANHGIRASVRGMEEVFRKISQNGTTREVEKDIATLDEVFLLQGMPSYQENERRYSPEAEKITAVIPAAADHKFQPELSTLLRDKPLCMLCVGGKPILEHQRDVLRSVGVRDLKVVIGYKKEKIDVQGLDFIGNPEFLTKKSAHSTLCGLQHAAGKTVIAYSDILFDRQILESLLKSPHPVTLVIDRAFRTLPRRDKSLDLVITEDQAQSLSTRKLGVGNFKKITRIGKKIDPKAASHEFIGMTFLSRQGLAWVKGCWQKALGNSQHTPFYEAANIGQASMTDLFQCMIDQGIEIYGLVIEHGWSEVYSLDDYERLDRYYREKTADLLYSS